ncbi:MAG: ArnT family glycosyltransferase [bacterium]
MSESSKVPVKISLLLIISAAFVLRFVGIWYGLPSLYNSDEPLHVINALTYGATKSLKPVYFDYPTLYSYFLFVIYGLYFLVGKIFGVFNTALDFGASYFLNPTGLFLVGRFVSVILGITGIWMVYKIGQRFFSKKIGLLSALILALSFNHVNTSHWILIEAAVVFMSALALYLILLFHENPTIKMNVLASFVAGLAISTKYNAGFIFVPLLLTSLLNYKRNVGNLFKNLGISIATLFIGFLLGTPYWLFSFSSFLQYFKWDFTQVGYGVVGHIRSVPLFWPLWKLILNDWTVGFLIVAGFIYVFFQREKKQILFLSFALPTILFVGTWNRADIHYVLPIYPSLVVLAAIFFNDILEYIQNFTVRVSLAVLLLFVPLIKIIYYDIRLIQKDTRALAEEWIESKIPEDSVLGYENFVYGPNLFDPSRFLKNPSESQILPLELKERLLQERRMRVSYNLVNFRKDFRPQRFTNNKKGYYSNPYFRKLLELRLPKLATLQKAGVEYLIISSDNYDRYFRSVPPKKGTPVWFSYQNGRNFYQSIFDSKAVILLNEFQPTYWNLGPTIKIYQFKSKLDDNRNGEKR